MWLVVWGLILGRARTVKQAWITLGEWPPPLEWFLLMPPLVIDVLAIAVLGVVWVFAQITRPFEALLFELPAWLIKAARRDNDADNKEANEPGAAQTHDAQKDSTDEKDDLKEAKEPQQVVSFFILQVMLLSLPYLALILSGNLAHSLAWPCISAAFLMLLISVMLATCRGGRLQQIAEYMPHFLAVIFLAIVYICFGVTHLPQVAGKMDWTEEWNIALLVMGMLSAIVAGSVFYRRSLLVRFHEVYLDNRHEKGVLALFRRFWGKRKLANDDKTEAEDPLKRLVSYPRLRWMSILACCSILFIIPAVYAAAVELFDWIGYPDNTNVPTIDWLPAFVSQIPEEGQNWNPLHWIYFIYLTDTKSDNAVLNILTVIIKAAFTYFVIQQGIKRVFLPSKLPHAQLIAELVEGAWNGEARDSEKLAVYKRLAAEAFLNYARLHGDAKDGKYIQPWIDKYQDTGVNCKVGYLAWRLEHRNTRTLSLRGAQLTDAWVNELVRLPRLASLDLSECYPLNNKTIKKLAKVRTLRSLRINSCRRLSHEGEVVLDNMKRLLELEMNDCGDVTANTLKDIAQLSNLRTLKLARSIEITQAEFDQLAKLSELKNLDLAGCIRDANAANFCWNSFPALEHLDLSECIVNGELLQGVAVLGKLRSLRLASPASQSFTPDKVANLADKLKRLRVLDFSGCGDVQAAMAELAGFSKLEKLSLQGCLLVEPSNLGYFLRSDEAPRALKELDLQGCAAVNNADLASIEKFHRLRSLDLEGTAVAGTLEPLEKLADAQKWNSLLRWLGYGRLTKMNLARCRGLINNGAQQLAKFPRLQDISLAWCNQITPEAIQKLVGLRYLNRLRIEGCRVNDKEFQKLQIKLPRVEITHW